MAVSRMDTVRNEEVRSRDKTESWLLSIEWIGEYSNGLDTWREWMMAKVSGGRLRGRPGLAWMDGVSGLRQQRNDGGGCAIMRER